MELSTSSASTAAPPSNGLVGTQAGLAAAAYGDWGAMGAYYHDNFKGAVYVYDDVR